MSELLLTGTRLLLLALLYLFLWRVSRVIASDLHGQQLGATGPTRPEVASSERRPQGARRAPRQLVVHEPGGAVHTVELAVEPVRIGRAPGVTVVVADDFVSDEHAEFLPEGDGWSVRDLGSTNGTHLNGGKVVRTTPVAAGDQVRVGKTRVEVRR